MDEEIKKTDECIPCKKAEEEKKSVSQKLKEENDVLETELVRQQKLKNESLLAGSSGGAVTPEPVKEESPKEYNDRIDKEISEGKHDE